MVSIITPVYNSAKYIGDTIKSVLSQTYQNWEMIIIDDCSKDESVSVIKSFNDSRLILIQLKVNVGAANARNIGLEKANGQFIAFIDADDMWKEDKLEKQLLFMKKNKIGFSFSSYEILREKKNKFIKVPLTLNYNQFMKNTIIGTLTVMLDTKIIGEIRFVNVKKDHDSMTWAKILKNGNTALGYSESLAYYRKLKGSISNNKFEAVKNHWKNCRKIEKIPRIKCLYFFVFYSFNALKKHYF